MTAQVIDIIRPDDIVTVHAPSGKKFEGHLDAAGEGPYYRLEFDFVYRGVPLYSAIQVLEENITEVRRDGRRIYWRGHHINWS